MSDVEVPQVFEKNYAVLSAALDWARVHYYAGNMAATRNELVGVASSARAMADLADELSRELA
jgi:hypothetical protein